jgi:arabinogalactan endo-1,4-beta-galactosidase
MKISEEFPSKYLKASDLQGRDVKVIMANVEREKLGDDMKLVLYFKGKEKGVVLNKTNSNTIVDAYGDDTDDWYDQELILFSVMVDFQGKVGPAIRCRVPTARDRKPKPDPITSGRSDFPGDKNEMEDEVGF